MFKCVFTRFERHMYGHRRKEIKLDKRWHRCQEKLAGKIRNIFTNFGNRATRDEL